MSARICALNLSLYRFCANNFASNVWVITAGGWSSVQNFCHWCANWKGRKKERKQESCLTTLNTFYSLAQETKYLAGSHSLLLPHELMQLNKSNALAVSMVVGDYAYKLWKLINAVVWYLDSYVCTRFLDFMKQYRKLVIVTVFCLVFCSLGFFTRVSSPALHSRPVLFWVFVQWTCTELNCLSKSSDTDPAPNSSLPDQDAEKQWHKITNHFSSI